MTVSENGVELSLNFDTEELAPNLNTARSAAAKIAEWIEKRIRKRSKSGKYNEPDSRLPNRYSTTPHYFDIREPRGGYSRFRTWMSSEGIEGRSKKRYVHLEQGYAQYRSIFRGTGMQYGPVNFQLTGDMLRNMNAKWERENGQAGFRATVTFSNRTRAGQRYSPRQKAEFVNSDRNFLYLTESEAEQAVMYGLKSTGMKFRPV